MTPFLTIITRSYRRPISLTRCVDSVARQTDPDVEQIIAHDPIGRGVGWSYLNLKHLCPTGEYVYLLDDDDMLIDNELVANLKRIAAEHDRPDVIYVDMDVQGTIMPNFEDGLVCGRISCSCFALRREVWIEHVADFIDDYSADFYFIETVANCAKQHTTAHLKIVSARTGRVSHGQPESIDSHS